MKSVSAKVSLKDALSTLVELFGVSRLESEWSDVYSIPPKVISTGMVVK
jgi:hypothetical protein